MFNRLQPSVVHAHSSIAGALVRLANLPRQVPVIYTPNGLTTNMLARTVERALGRFASRIVAVSESEAERARAWRLAEPSKVVVIPNGIEPDRPAPGPDIRAALGIPKEVPLVGTIARLVPQKAPELFVEVAREVGQKRPDAHFLLIGMGPLDQAVEMKVANEGLTGRFHRIEHLDQAGSVLDQLDVFVLASRFEGGPYAPLEAIRADVPAVLSDVVGNRDVVEHGVSGFLVPFGDSPQMADAVTELLGDPSLRTSITRAARERLRNNFDVRLMGAAVGALYEEVAFEWSRRSTRRLPHPRSATSTQTPESNAAL
jgi:glycosyltransferase involved in cell wall biosynthesis